jgi:hypothetical protein
MLIVTHLVDPSSTLVSDERKGYAHTNPNGASPLHPLPSAAERTWILDPIDGTKGFIRGEHFCVALALARHGQPTLGVLGCPNVPATGGREQVRSERGGGGRRALGEGGGGVGGWTMRDPFEHGKYQIVIPGERSGMHDDD